MVWNMIRFHFDEQSHHEIITVYNDILLKAQSVTLKLIVLPVSFNQLTQHHAIQEADEIH